MGCPDKPGNDEIWLGVLGCTGGFGRASMEKIFGIVLLGIVAVGPALADDSTAMLGAGGLQFTKAADVRMAREDLFISSEAVRIRYAFANDGARDVDTLVAFPLPDIDLYEFAESPIGTVGKDPVNFVDFKVVADGRSVPVEVEQRAFIGGRDVTQIVKSAGLPVNMLVANGYGMLNKMPPAKKKALEHAGVAEYGGAPDQEYPKWTVRTKFYWMQHFPAGKTVIIEHSYHPVTGQAFFTDYELDKKQDASARNWQRDYCMDGPTLSAIRQKLAARKAAMPDNALLNIRSTDFILKTANNWKGGIGVLHLTVDKLKPDNILSMCWNGDLKKTGPTTFESTLTDVQPANDIKIAVLE
jgi:hypothetical protein